MIGRTVVAQYAYALGIDDPTHLDQATGIEHRYPDVVAPGTFCVARRLLAQNLVPAANCEKMARRPSRCQMFR